MSLKEGWKRHWPLGVSQGLQGLGTSSCTWGGSHSSGRVHSWHSEHCEEESGAVELCLVEELEVDYGLLLEEVRGVDLHCFGFQDCTDG